MLQQQTATGRRAVVSAQGQWPQYRKYSSAPTRRQLFARAGLTVAVCAVVAVAWLSGDRMEAPADMHVVTYVNFPRVEIVAKRPHSEDVVASVKAAWIKFVGAGD